MTVDFGGETEKLITYLMMTTFIFIYNLYFHKLLNLCKF